MKKYYNYLGIIAAAAMTLVSCAKEADNFTAEEPIKDGGEFTIVANPATKTTIDGYQTKWAADDAINLFHAVAGSTTFVNDGEFTIADEDLASGTFKGTLGNTPDSGTYDWYAMYPYVKQKTGPATISAGYTPVGSTASGIQTQKGNNSTAHLAGKNYPLSGKASAVAFDATPSIQLKSLCTFVEVNVTNNSGAPLTIATVEFTAPEDIIGTFYIDISDPSNIDYIPSGPTYVSTTASLNVAGAAAIEDGASAKFYLGMKPFSTTTGQEIQISVNGYDKVFTTAKDFSFQAGKIKTVNFDYDAAPDPYSWVKTPIGSLVAGDVVVIVDENSSTALSSANGSSSAPAASSVAISSNKLSSTPSEDLQFVLEASAGNYSFKAINTTNYLYTTNTNNGVRVGTNDNKVFEWDGGYLKNVATSRYVGVYDNQDWRCYTSINANIQDTQTAFYKKTLAYPSTPQPSVSLLKNAIDDVLAAGVDAEVESDVYTLTDADDTDITVTVDGTIVTDATAADGDVLYSVAANTGSARSGWIKIAVAGGNTVQIDVNQLSGETGKSYTITWNSINNSKGVSSYTATWSVTADGLTCNMTNWNNNNNGWNYVKCGSKSAASVATIITDTAIPEAIKTVKITIDAVTAANINSIKLYVSDSNTFGSTEEASFAVGTGEKSVTISSPAANKYYKLEFDCKKSGSNGPLTLSQLVFTTE